MLLKHTFNYSEFFFVVGVNHIRVTRMVVPVMQLGLPGRPVFKLVFTLRVDLCGFQFLGYSLFEVLV